MPIDFLAIGELLADIITIDYANDLSEARSFEIFQGGSPANVAANVKYLGKNTALISCVGNDGIGKFLINALTKIGISDKYIQVTDAHPTSLVLVTRSKGTPDFIAYRAADPQLKPISEDLIKSSSIIHTTAFALSKQPARDVILNVFEIASALGKKVSVDWNFAPSIWGDDDGKEVFRKILSLRPLLKVSEDDIQRFVGHKISVEECKAFLNGSLTSVTCLTCGKDGVWYRDSNNNWQHLKASPVAEVKDTTGAGDAFWAGFIAATIDERSAKDCVQKGLETAAAKIQKKGPLYL